MYFHKLFPVLVVDLGYVVTFTQIKWLHINKTERYSTRQSMHNINRKRQNSMYNHLLYPLQSIYSRKFL